MLTLTEKKLLLNIDRKISSAPGSIDPAQLRTYRALLSRFVEANVQQALAGQHRPAKDWRGN